LSEGTAPHTEQGMDRTSLTLASLPKNLMKSLSLLEVPMFVPIRVDVAVTYGGYAPRYSYVDAVLLNMEEFASGKESASVSFAGGCSVSIGNHLIHPADLAGIKKDPASLVPRPADGATHNQGSEIP